MRARLEEVTIVVVCCNYADYLRRALESALSQTVEPHEVLCVDDGSEDGSLAVMREYGSCITVCARGHEGVVSARNFALSRVKTDWVIFLDADDQLAPSYLEDCLGQADRKRADVVYTDMEFFGSQQGIFRAGQYHLYRLRKYNFVHGSALMRSSCIRNVGGYKEEMKDGFEDWELYLSLAESGVRFSYLPFPLLYCRRHAGSRGKKITPEMEKCLVNRLHELHPKLFNRIFFAMKSIEEKLPWRGRKLSVREGERS